jgi:hypothetical protein
MKKENREYLRHYSSLSRNKDNKREYYIRNKDFKSRYDSEYYIRNTNDKRESSHRYYIRNKDNRKKYNREYYLRRREVRRSNEMKSWKSPEVVREYFESIVNRLSVSNFSDWYRISRAQIGILGGMSILCFSPFDC